MNNFNTMSHPISLTTFTLFWNGAFGGELSCLYEIDSPSSGNLDLHTDTIGNRSVFTLNITRVDSTDVVNDITVKEQNSSSSYFEIINNELFVKSCPPVGESQAIQTILIEPEMVILYPCIDSFSVTAVPSIPEIMVIKNASVLVNSFDNDLDVLNFDFANENDCTNFSCAVNCTNDNKAFWIDDVNVIRTSPHNIKFDFPYELDLTCYEGGPRNNETNSAMVQVNFRRITTTGNSAESSAMFTRACVGIVCCIAYIRNIFF